MDLTKLPDSVAYQEAAWLLKKMYQFDAAYSAQDMKRMRKILKKVKKRKTKELTVHGPLSSYFHDAWTHMKYDYKQFKFDDEERSEQSDMDTLFLLITGDVPFTELIHVSLMLDGMTLDEAKTAYALGMEPVWKATNPF